MKRILSALTAFVIGVPLISASSQTSTPGRLTFGPHIVGFRVVCDTAGRSAPAREQLLVWYPARRPSASEPMRFGEYLAPSRTNECGSPASTDDQRQAALTAFARFIAPMFGAGEEPIGGRMFPNDSAPGIATRLVSTMTRAHLTAEPVVGKFPVVVFAGTGAIEQSVLLESLASHGYVVVTFPSTGLPPSVARPGVESGRESHLAMAREIGRAINAAARFSNADTTRVAVMASGSGIAGAIWFQAQTSRLSALITNEGRYPGAQRRPSATAPSRPLAVRASDSLPSNIGQTWIAPILDLKSLDGLFTRGVLDSLSRAERIRVDMRVGHPNSDGIRRLVYPGDTIVSTANDILGAYVQQFLAYAIEHRNGASAFFDRAPGVNDVRSGLITVSRMRP